MLTIVYATLMFPAAMLFSCNYTVKAPILPKVVGVTVPASQPFANSNTLLSSVLLQNTVEI